MKHHGIRLTGLLSILVLAAAAAAGTWSPHNFFYQPSLGARGPVEKGNFDIGLERVDAHLGKYKTLGDPGYGTLAEALDTIGTETQVTLNIPAGTVPVAVSTTIPSNIALRVLRGGKFDISDGAILTIQGPLDAGPYRIFSWSGSGKASFGSKAAPELIPEWWGAEGVVTADDTIPVNMAKTAAAAAGIPLRFVAGKTYPIDQLVIDTSGMKVIAYDATLLHNGDNKALIKFGAQSGGAMKRTEWRGGRLMAKQSATDPTTEVFYVQLCFHCTVSDVDIDAGAGRFKNDDKYADYGIRIYGDSELGGTYYNTFHNIKVFGAATAGIKFDGVPGTASFCNNNTFVSCIVQGNQKGVHAYVGRYNAFMGGNVENNVAQGIDDDDKSYTAFFGTWVENNSPNIDADPTSYAGRSIFIGSCSTVPNETSLKKFSVYDATGHSYKNNTMTNFLNFVVQRSSAGQYAYCTKVESDSHYRYYIASNGVNWWGPGNAAPDVLLSRPAANILALGSGDGLGVGNAVSNMSTPSGPTAKALPIYDHTGSLLGYIPVYGSQW